MENNVPTYDVDTSIEILNLSDYDPDKDIIVVYVGVGKMPHEAVKQKMSQVKDTMNYMFKSRGFDVLYIPRRVEKSQSDKIVIADKKDANTLVDEAINAVNTMDD